MVQEGELALTDSLPLNSSGQNGSPQAVYEPVEDADTLESEIEPVYVLVYNAPPPAIQSPPRAEGNLGVSFIITGIFILFLIVALRFRNNIKYVVATFHNLVDTRTRQNVFDDTVRETSLMVLLNILWCACAGIIGYCVYQYFFPYTVPPSMRSVGMLWGMAIAAVYTLFLWWAYAAVGWVFSDRAHAVLWVKGFAASQAIMTPFFFITALIGICSPENSVEVGLVAAVIFILAKLVFIWKGYRIFFNQFSSWVLFLCYLCSLEIVPLILCYRGAVLLGEVFR